MIYNIIQKRHDDDNDDNNNNNNIHIICHFSDLLTLNFPLFM
jgi:hypothetical protein